MSDNKRLALGCFLVGFGSGILVTIVSVEKELRKILVVLMK